MTTSTFDPVWSERYGHGHSVRCPYDVVFTFIYRNAPKNKDRSQVRVLEVGCGTGNNIWFGAIEGFSMTGIDGSPEAIEYARKRLDHDGLKADLAVGDVAQLPYPDQTFDLAVDRGCLTHCGFSHAKRAVAEISRILVPGGKFFCNTYSSAHTTAKSGHLATDNLTVGATKGAIIGWGQICFYTEALMKDLFPAPWRIDSLKHSIISEAGDVNEDIHAEWCAVATKV